MKRPKADFFTRLFFILLLFFMSPIVSIVFIIGIIQLLSLQTHEKPIASLITISSAILGYVIHIIEYITLLQTQPPFPFSPWQNRYDP